MTIGSQTDDGGQTAFIGRIRSALRVGEADRPTSAEVLASVKTDAAVAALERIRNRSREESLELLEQLRAAARPINLQVEPVPDLQAAGRMVQRIAHESEPEWGGDKAVAAWGHPLVDALELKGLLSPADIQVHRIGAPDMSDDPDESVRDDFAAKVRASFVGVTGADYCVAESATLIMKTRSGQSRSVSLVPSIHIAVIRLDQILETFTELYSQLCFDPEQKREGLGGSMTLISGPSKTADIEACMVHGAHGPREVYLIVILRN